MKKVKIGVFGAGRGQTMMRYCMLNPDAELVAICDKNEKLLEARKKQFGAKGKHVRYFTDFDTFLKESGVDAVVLANYANDHAPYAIKAMEAGKHVLSEVLPVETLKEAVELCEAVERTGKIYAYAENYCYFASTREMKRLFDNGYLGEFEYGEGEYIHNCQPGWAGLTAGGWEGHWRNVMSAFYYCTHSAGPLVHMVRKSGIRPVKVSGTEGPYNKRMKDMCAGGASVAVEMVTLSNGGIFKSIHGLGLSGNNIWYSAYGTNGRAESAREYAGVTRKAPLYCLYVNGGNTEDDALTETHKYCPKLTRRARQFGHSGSDWYIMNNFCKRIRGEEADTVDVYEALDMYFVGHFGYLSALEGGAAQEIPDFRDKAVREKYRNDTRCPDKNKAGDQLLPSNTQGGWVIGEAEKEHMKWRAANPVKRGFLKKTIFEMKKYFNRGRVK